MAIGDIIVGIDIGSSKISLVVGEVNNFNQVELVYTVEHKCKGIKKTKIIDEDEIANAIVKSIQDAEREAEIKINLQERHYKKYKRQIFWSFCKRCIISIITG